MKGLLIKDICTLWKQARFMLLLVLLYIVIGAWKPENSFWATLSVLFMSMLPVNALGLDERCKWNQYALMLPCSRKDMVLEKYILGLSGIMGVVMIYGGITCIMQLAGGKGLSVSGIGQSLIPMLSLPCLYLGINMPVMFRYGVEKGRMWFILLTMVMFGFVVAKDSLEQEEGFAATVRMLEAENGVWGSGIGMLILAGSVIILVFSMLLSVRIFEKKEL